MKKSLTLLSLSLCAVIVAGSWHVVSARATSDEDGVSSSGLESTKELLLKQREQLREAVTRAEEQKREAEKARLEVEKEKEVELKEKRDQKVADAKKKVCENRESAIKKIVERTATNGQHHYEMITKVYDNVKAFATKKGVDLATLSTEVKNADNAAIAAMKAIDAAKTSGGEFTCTSSTPKSAASAFLATKKAQAAALKAYRDAVKQLLAAVKSSVQKTDTTTKTDTDTTKTDDTTAGGTQ